MELRNKFSLSLCLLCLFANAQGKLVEVASKQSLTEMRYSSEDGKIVYYQNHSGELFYSTNYRVSKLLASNVPKNTDYQVIVSKHRKYALIAQDTHMHDFLSVRKERNLFQLKVGETNPSSIGTGIFPQLHMQDQWISYFKPVERTIILRGISSSNKEYQIQLSNSVNPYFIPQVVMLSEKIGRAHV